MIIDFGEYLPDQHRLGNPGSTTVKNAIPFDRGYIPFPGPAVYSNALDARCQGVFICNDKSGNTYNFAGNASKIYSLSSGTFSDVSKVGGYTTGGTERWEGVKYGDVAIMTNFTDNIQAITLGGTNFADLAGSPPKARHIAVVKDQVVIGNVDDAIDGIVPQRIKTSAIGDHTDWTPSSSTGSIEQDIEDIGWCRRIIGGEYGTLFFERGIVRMTFTGGIETYQFDVIEQGRGTRSPGSVIQIGKNIFYLGIDGFYVHNGETSEPIGKNKVDKSFFADLDESFHDRISAVADPSTSTVIWSYPGAGSSSGTSNKLIMFNWTTGRWGYAEVECELVCAHLTEGVTLEGLDAYGTLDSLPYSLDSRVWTGGAFNLAMFDTSHKLNDFASTSLTATFTPSEIQLFAGSKGTIKDIRTLIDGGTHTVKLYYRNNQADAQSATDNLVQRGSGSFAARTTARYHQPEVTASGAWTYARGVEVDGIQRGKR